MYRQPRQALGECGFSSGQGQLPRCRLGVGSSYVSPTPSRRLCLRGWPALPLVREALQVCPGVAQGAHALLGHLFVLQAPSHPTWEWATQGNLKPLPAGPQVACFSCILPANQEKGPSVATNGGQVPSLCFFYGSPWLDFIYSYAFCEFEFTSYAIHPLKLYNSKVFI